MAKKKKRKNKNNNLVAFVVSLLVVLLGGGVVLLLMYRKQTANLDYEWEEPVDGGEVIELTVEDVPGPALEPAEDETETTPDEVVVEEPEELPPYTYRIDKPAGENVKFTFAGDILLDDGYATMSHYRNVGGDLERLFTNGLLDDMRNADIFMINNEFTFTTNGAPRPEKIYTFRAKPENVNILKDMGVDIVSAANNHISDYGMISTTDTLDTLTEAGIPYVGAGYNLEDASKVVYYQTGDTKVGIVCATQIERYENPDTPGATETSAGTFRALHPEAVIEKIKEAKQNADVVVLYIHWGAENEVAIHWSQSGQVGGYVDAGADVIIGDHPHILQGIGYVGDTPVFYSLGNYWFSSKTTDTCLVNMEVSGGEIKSLQFVPCVSESCIVRKSKDGEKDRILNYMRSLSSGVNIDDDGYISKN